MALIRQGTMQAFQLTKEMLADETVSPKVQAASANEVKRVLSAKTDHEVMQTWPGISKLLVRKNYRSMTLALHPDKCKVYTNCFPQSMELRQHNLIS